MIYKRIPWNKGKHNIYSKETIKKMSLAKKGISLKPEHIAKIKQSAKKGFNSPLWKGGKKIRKDGYILIYSPNHPYNINSYVYEHRLVMEVKIGRFLNPTEAVHHINRNPSDNRIENLKIIEINKHLKNHQKEYRDNIIKYYKDCKCCKKKYKIYKHELTTSNYCSSKCRQMSHRNGSIFNCPICNKEFYRNKAQQKESIVHYCSIICWYKSIKSKSQSNKA